MESANGTAGDGDAQHGEHLEPFGVAAGKAVGEFGHPSVLAQYASAHAYSHDEQCQAEEGIDAAYELVDGQHGGQDVIEEDDCRPEGGTAHPAPVGCERGQQACGGGHKNRSHQKHQQQGQHTHGVAHGSAQLGAHNLGQRHASHAQAHHTAQIVMDCTGKDASCHYPQIGGGPEEDAHDGTEDGTCACNVEKLYEEHFPCGHGDIVHSVGAGVAGGGQTGVAAEYFFHEGPVQQIAEQKAHKCHNKCNHFFLLC